LVADHVVRGQHQQQRIGAIGLGLQGRGGDRRRSVAAHRLEQQGRGRHAHLAQLFGHHEAVLLVSHHDRRPGAGQPGQALPGGLQQRLLAHQRLELLGMGLARQRPEPGTGATGQQDGDDRDHGGIALENRPP
jgi:hypothetical protein